MRFTDYKGLYLKEDIGHLYTRLSKEELICVLQPIYPKNDLAAYSHDQLFDIYKKNIEAGKIPYDKSKGYSGSGCSNGSSSSNTEQAKEPPKPSSLYKNFRNTLCQLSVGGGNPMDRAKEKAKCDLRWK
jgi:hypothetical protein